MQWFGGPFGSPLWAVCSQRLLMAVRLARTTQARSWHTTHDSHQPAQGRIVQSAVCRKSGGQAGYSRRRRSNGSTRTKSAAPFSTSGPALPRPLRALPSPLCSLHGCPYPSKPEWRRPRVRRRECSLQPLSADSECPDSELALEHVLAAAGGGEALAFVGQRGLQPIRLE